MKRELPPNVSDIRFGVTPYLGPELTAKSYQPVTDYLSDSLGVGVSLTLASSYGDLITKVEKKDVDIFLISPLSYVLAKQRAPSIELLARESASGMASYSAYIIVREESRAQSLRDLIGLRIGFVDRNSTSGFLFPMASFLDAGINPVDDLKFCFSKSHIQAITDLVNKRVEAVTVSSNMVNFLADEKSVKSILKQQGFRILHKAGRIPYDALAARGDFSESGLEKIQSAFAHLNTRSPRGRKALALSADITGWVPAADSDYDPVRRILRVVETFLKTNPFPPEQRCDSEF
jgi:phosphonate transport system substrate-binding protein